MFDPLSQGDTKPLTSVAVTLEEPSVLAPFPATLEVSSPLCWNYCDDKEAQGGGSTDLDHLLEAEELTRFHLTLEHDGYLLLETLFGGYGHWSLDRRSKG